MEVYGFIASPDEKDPTKAVYAEDTHTHWKYTGKKATQYWYCSNPSNELEGVVNGRYTYWASKSPIPGGIAYENFELTEPSVWSKLYFWYHTSFTGRINKPHYEIRTDYFLGRTSFPPYLSPLLFLIYRTEKDKRWIKIRKG